MAWRCDSAAVSVWVDKIMCCWWRPEFAVQHYNLTIGYKDGYLYDLDTSYGYGPGQTAWQDRVRNWYEGGQKEYFREREEELKREENIPSKFEMAVKETEDYMRETFGERSVFGSQRAEVQLGST